MAPVSVGMTNCKAVHYVQTFLTVTVTQEKNVISSEGFIIYIRTAQLEDAEGIAKVHVDNWLDTYSGMLPEKSLRTWTYEERIKRWQASIQQAVSGGTRTFVAESSGRITGFVLAGTMRDATLRMRYSGEVYGLFVQPEYQSKGLGKELLISAFQHLHDYQHSRAALWVPNVNKSRGFFEYMGASKVYEAPVEIGGESFMNEAYGWESMREAAKISETHWN